MRAPRDLFGFRSPQASDEPPEAARRCANDLTTLCARCLEARLDVSESGLLAFVSRWTIVRVRPVSPQAGSDRDTAFAIHFAEDDQPEPQMTVEYAAPSSLASTLHAREAAGPYLDDDEPPRRLIVSREGEIRVAD